MSSSNNLDARAVANAVLREAWARGQSISNLKLQKLLYLCHAFFLIKTGGQNLIKENFEAWQYGPVHRDAYEAFKVYGDKPIQEAATRFNPVTRERISIDAHFDQEVRDIVYEVVRNYGNQSASDLVKLTHAVNGPWDYVVTLAASQANMALKIDNKIIRERFKYHWFGAKPHIQGKEPDDEELLIA